MVCLINFSRLIERADLKEMIIGTIAKDSQEFVNLDFSWPALDAAV